MFVVPRRGTDSTPSAARRWIGDNRDLLLVGSAGLLLLAAGRSAWWSVVAAAKETLTVQMSLETAAAAAAAILAAVVHRLAPDRRAAWISVAFALYALGGLPLLAIGLAADSGRRDVELVRLLACALVVGLFYVAVCAPRRRRSVRPLWIAALMIAALALAAVVLSCLPGVVELLNVGASGRLVVAAGGLGAGALLLGRAVVEGSPQLTRVGAGITAITATDVIWHGLLWSGAHPPTATLGAWRCVGLVLVLLGLSSLARRTLQSVRETEERCRRELTTVLETWREFAERELELRTSLGGLTTLLTGPAEDASARRALRSELELLESLLAPDPGTSGGAGGRETPVPGAWSARAS